MSTGEENKEPRNQMCLVTSVMFLTLAAHAWLRGLWLYSLAWVGLSVTSVLVHGWGLCRKVDKALVYAVVALGAYYYYVLVWVGQKHTLSYLLLTVPVVTFVGCVLLYHVVRDRVDHVWVHVLTMLGHHCILFGFM